MKLPLDSKAIDPKEISAIPAAFRMARHFSADVTVENRPLHSSGLAKVHHERYRDLTPTSRHKIRQ